MSTILHKLSKLISEGEEVKNPQNSVNVSSLWMPQVLEIHQILELISCETAKTFYCFKYTNLVEFYLNQLSKRETLLHRKDQLLTYVFTTTSYEVLLPM